MSDSTIDALTKEISKVIDLSARAIQAKDYDLQLAALHHERGRAYVQTSTLSVTEKYTKAVADFRMALRHYDLHPDFDAGDKVGVIYMDIALIFSGLANATQQENFYQSAEAAFRNAIEATKTNKAYCEEEFENFKRRRNSRR